jgi:non-specific serine/threonine protein kinase
VAYWLEDYEESLRLQEECLRLAKEVGERYAMALSLYGMGRAVLRMGDHDRARSHLLESLTLRRELGLRADVAESLGALASLETAAGRSERAARLLGASEALREATRLALVPNERKELERDTHALRSRLGAEPFVREREGGKALSFSEAIDYALDV